MAKSRQNSLMWNIIFLLLMVAVGVISYMLIKKREGFSEASSVEKIKKGNGVLVVTLDGCPHCDDMKPDLESLSADPKMKSHFAWVDSTDESVADLEIASYPTIFVFKDGESTEFTERSKDKIEEAVKSTMM